MTLARTYTGPALITRSAADRWGMGWPTEIACMINGRPVTWPEMGQQKRQRQREQLARKQRPEPVRIVPAYVWTFRVPGTFFAGWWCYVVTREDRFPAMWHEGGRFGNAGLAESIVRAWPMGLLPIAENFERWMRLLAKTRPRRHARDPRPAGSLIGWFDTRYRGRFALSREELVRTLTPDT